MKSNEKGQTLSGICIDFFFNRILNCFGIEQFLDEGSIYYRHFVSDLLFIVRSASFSFFRAPNGIRILSKCRNFNIFPVSSHYFLSIMQRKGSILTSNEFNICSEFCKVLAEKFKFAFQAPLARHVHMSGKFISDLTISITFH